MINIFDNKIHKVGNDLRVHIKNKSKLNIAASIFSIYGFESLKKELSKIEELKKIVYK